MYAWDNGWDISQNYQFRSICTQRNVVHNCFDVRLLCSIPINIYVLSIHFGFSDHQLSGVRPSNQFLQPSICVSVSVYEFFLHFWIFIYLTSILLKKKQFQNDELKKGGGQSLKKVKKKQKTIYDMS